MSIKTHRKIGFIAALTMVLGTVVGIGIFLKNHSILKANDWSGTGTLVSWLIGGLLALCAAISFSEISGQKTGKTSGLSDWAEKGFGKTFGYIVRSNYSLIYFSIMTLVIGMFASETIFSVFTSITHTKMPHMGYIALLGVGLITLTCGIALMSVKVSGHMQTITTVLKFVPLVLVVVLGLALATTNKSPNGLFGQNAFSNGQSFDFTKMLAALPAVLFAYDAFLVSSQIKNKMKNPEKLPLVVSLGMIIVIVLYCFIAISAILHGSGMVSGGVVGAPPEGGYGIFDQIFPHDVAKGMGTFIIIFLAISTYGVLNGISVGAVYTTMMVIETDTFYGSKKLKAKHGVEKTTAIYLIGSLLFYTLIILVPAIIFNDDAILDASSNVPVLLAFLAYSLVILGYTLKRDKTTHKKLNNKIFKPFAWLGIVGILFIFGYQLFYGLTIHLIINDPNLKNSSGLFRVNPNHQFTNIDLFYTFIGIMGIAIVLPLGNYLLVKKFEKRNPIVSTQQD